MNGAQIYKVLLNYKGKTARELVAMGAKATAWHIGRQCERHPYIYIAEWKEEWNQMKGWEWVPIWAAFEPPADAVRPDRRKGVSRRDQ